MSASGPVMEGGFMNFRAWTRLSRDRYRVERSGKVTMMVKAAL